MKRTLKRVKKVYDGRKKGVKEEWKKRVTWKISSNKGDLRVKGEGNIEKG